MLKKTIIPILLLLFMLCNIVEQNSIDEEQYYDIWDIYNTQHNYPKAITEFENFIKKYPYSSKYDNALFYCGKSYVKLAEETSDNSKKIEYLNSSIKKFEQVPDKSPQYVDALYYTAYAKDLIMQTSPTDMPKDNVISAYKKIINLFPTNDLAKLSESRIKQLEG